MSDDFSPLHCYYLSNLFLPITFTSCAGEVVVQSTDGLSRTSTVLMAMDQIHKTGCLNIKQVLTNLRQCRPGMVSKQEDFNFAMEILDDLPHGIVTAQDACAFKRNLVRTAKVITHAILTSLL